VCNVAPFNVRWTIERPGSFTFYAIAYDAAGNKIKSDEVKVKVNPKQE
jgi:hypothetical protein